METNKEREYVYKFKVKMFVQNDVLRDVSKMMGQWTGNTNEVSMGGEVFTITATNIEKFSAEELIKVQKRLQKIMDKHAKKESCDDLTYRYNVASGVLQKNS